MWPELGSNPQRWDNEQFELLKISVLNHAATRAAVRRNGWIPITSQNYKYFLYFWSPITSFVLFYLFMYILKMLKIKIRNVLQSVIWVTVSTPSFFLFSALFKIIYWNKGVFLYYCNRRDRGTCVHRQEKPRPAIPSVWLNYCCEGRQRHRCLTAASATEVSFTVTWRQKNRPSCEMTSDFQALQWDRPICGNRPRLWDWPCLWVLYTYQAFTF